MYTAFQKRQIPTDIIYVPIIKRLNLILSVLLHCRIKSEILKKCLPLLVTPCLRDRRNYFARYVAPWESISKKFETRSTFAEVMIKNQMSCLLDGVNKR